MKMEIGLTLMLLLIVPIISAYGESAEGILQVDIMSPTGERVDYHGMVLKIYQDASETPIVESLTANPYDISLPLGHRYKIEAYASSMYAGVGFAKLESNNQKLELRVPIPGSARFTVVYSDGNTPIDGASVSLRSTDGTYRYWTNSTTDAFGFTIRFWLQPTIIKSDYYIADISLSNDLSYSFYPVIINPGRSQDIRVVTPWPKIIDQLIVVSVYDYNSKKISGLDADLAVEVYDTNGNKITSSILSHKGDAYFSNLKVGTYLFRVVNLEQPQNEEWGSTKIILTGKSEPIQIFTKPYESQNETSDLISSLPENTQTNPPETVTNEESTLVPSWIKNIADLWAKGQISDIEFLNAVEYLVNNNIITVQNLRSS
jgi:hypothetical protein